MQSGGTQGGTQGGGGGGTTAETITPVTFKQIKDADFDTGSEKLTINGAVAEQITVVARIIKADVQMTMIAFTLDDCTGRMEGSHMLPADEAAGSHEFAVQKRERLKEGAWTRLVGVVDTMNEARRLWIYKIRAVDDFNEILYHRLDVVKTFLSLTRPKALSNGHTQPKSATGNYNSAIPPTSLNDTSITAEDGLTLTPLQREIYEYVKARSSSNPGNGVPLQDIQRDIQSNASLEIVREIMEGFATDGHVYTSVDENHFVFCAN